MLQLLLNLSLLYGFNISVEESPKNSEKLRKAAVYTLKEFSTRSQTYTNMKHNVKIKYRNLTTKDQRVIIGYSASIMQILIDRRIVWEYRF